MNEPTGNTADSLCSFDLSFGRRQYTDFPARKPTDVTFVGHGAMPKCGEEGGQEPETSPVKVFRISRIPMRVAVYVEVPGGGSRLVMIRDDLSERQRTRLRSKLSSNG